MKDKCECDCCKGECVSLEGEIDCTQIDSPTIDVKIFILFLLLGFLFGFLGSNPYKTWAWSKS